MKKLWSMDAWIGVALMIFSAWFWILSSDFPDAAKLFPRTFLAITFVLAAVLVVSTIRHNKMNPPEESSKKSDIQDTLLIVKAYLFMAIYFICIRVVGFFTSTTVFLVGFMYFLKVRNVKTLVLVTVGMDVFLYLLFGLGLRLNLPTGLLF